jgi:hypothetical protein
VALQLGHDSRFFRSGLCPLLPRLSRRGNALLGNSETERWSALSTPRRYHERRFSSPRLAIGQTSRREVRELLIRLGHRSKSTRRKNILRDGLNCAHGPKWSLPSAGQGPSAYVDESAVCYHVKVPKNCVGSTFPHRPRLPVSRAFDRASLSSFPFF